MKAWEHNIAKTMMEKYRRAQEDYYVKAKPLQDLGNGMKAFSLITPPQGSPVARRRVRLVMKNLASDGNADAPHLLLAGRAPHVITVAVTYDCQCDCLHCSAVDHREAVRRDRSALSLDELKSAIDQCIDMGTTCVSPDSPAAGCSSMAYSILSHPWTSPAASPPCSPTASS